MRKKVWGVGIIGLTMAMCIALTGCSSSTATQDSSSSSTKSVSIEEAISSEASSSVGDRYVSVSWLQDHADEVVLVDARSAKNYAAEHIPGAVNLHWSSVSNAAVPQGGAGWAELLDTADLAKAVAALGIDGSKPVVIYTDPSQGWGEDGRILWTLGEAGVSDVYILDGGSQKWTAEGGEMVSGFKATDVDPIKQVDTTYVKDHMASAKIVDARTADEFAGNTTMGEARPGRIPGAVNIPSVDLYNEDGTLKSAEDLKALASKAGLAETDEIIVYCTGGVRAANVAEVLVGLGYDNVNVYTAGFSEWAADSANAVS